MAEEKTTEAKENQTEEKSEKKSIKDKILDSKVANFARRHKGGLIGGGIATLAAGAAGVVLYKLGKGDLAVDLPIEVDAVTESIPFDSSSEL